MTSPNLTLTLASRPPHGFIVRTLGPFVPVGWSVVALGGFVVTPLGLLMVELGTFVVTPLGRLTVALGGFVMTPLGLLMVELGTFVVTPLGLLIVELGTFVMPEPDHVEEPCWIWFVGPNRLVCPLSGKTD